MCVNALLGEKFSALCHHIESGMLLRAFSLLARHELMAYRMLVRFSLGRNFFFLGAFFYDTARIESSAE